MAACSFPGLLEGTSGEATLDDPSLCYQDPGRLTGKLENIHCPRGPVGGSASVISSNAVSGQFASRVHSRASLRAAPTRIAFHASCARVITYADPHFTASVTPV